MDYKGTNRTALLLCDLPQRRSDLEALATACQCSVVDYVTDFYDGMPSRSVDFILADLSSISEHTDQSLSKIARYLVSHQTIALIWTDMERLEAAYATLPAERCHFLVDASDIEAMPILTCAYGRNRMDQVHGRDRDIQFGALHKISDELAGFARTLARIAEQDEADISGVADKPVSFRPAPAGTLQPFSTVARIKDEDVSPAMIREMIKLRRLRDSYFEKDLFADPAWDILLDLMASRLEGRPVSVSSLCIAAAVPATTALRWITAMTESGMLVRQHDPNDARRIFIELSTSVEAALREYLVAAQQRSAPLV